MRMQKMISIGVLILGSSVAMAGLVQPAPVSVTLNTDGSGSANGNMATARFSKNDVELIGCGIRRLDTGGGGLFVFGFCQATTADEIAGFCSTEDAALIESISDLDDYSFITFSWNAEGTCRAIGSSTQSFYIPK